ncbi:hypothetical protein TraAM80_07187 [Trypanosoma rangeli]|uniref:Dynein assembly factor 1, axonemal homolog n=1 Tax=Trypanosoma rangeli TaxID=5698 RepID=A0A422N6Q2_TRYRA|nr:uncharacterized protein TraAM80_07187 [Trypanosoma rangeli]RNF01135.1 hypothetical protein TraAM80_07187 [Trypanosoma rangeli]|eukprot:RNF01135.1 hypothetical protein TraAM80_07187 [Trypanosoma rangeli]
MERTSNLTTITTEKIKKICVQLGYYRNPVCNEKLYLHHKGFDSIDEDAFDAYTDVKVLWLEGNVLTRIPCGKDSMPRRKPQSQAEVSLTKPAPASSLVVGCSKSTQQESCKTTHVDHCTDWTTAPPPHISASAEAQQDNTTADVAAGSKSSAVSTTTTTAPPDNKDVFQSLYPTLRQLFLHNNALREMPDLSGFQRLDTVNLSCNCIRSVQANCAAFSAKVAQFEAAQQEKLQVLMANSKSMQNELRTRETHLHMAARQSQSGCKNAGRDFALSAATTEETTTTTGVKVNDVEGEKEEAKVVVAGDGGVVRFDMDMWRKRLSAYADFCPHEPLEVVENGKLSDGVPSGCRNPCSSIRTLNLSANYLTNVDDIVQLLCFKNLAVLDLSNNQLDNGEAVLLIMERLPRLRSLKLSGNPLVRSLPRYRKMVLARCPGLLHLDDRPVFADERRLVTAWVRGGDEAENKERLLMREETEKQHIRRLEEFRAMVNRYRPTDADGPDFTRVNDGERELPPQIGLQGPPQRGLHSPARPSDDDVTSSESDENVDREENPNPRQMRAARQVVGSNNVQNTIAPAPGLAHIARAPMNTHEWREEPSCNSRSQAGGQPQLDLHLSDDEEGDIYIPPSASQ